MARLPELIGLHPGKGADDTQISTEADRSLRMATLTVADYVEVPANPPQASQYWERD